MTKLLRLLCLAPLVLPTGAWGDFFFLHVEGHWTVYSNPRQDRCEAANRPGLEANYYPYAFVRLSRHVDDDGIGIDAHYWPGALREGTAGPLVLSTPDNRRVEVPAQAPLDFAARADRPIARADVETLLGSDVIFVQFKPVAIAVDTTQLATVLARLDQCAALMKSGG